MDHQAQAPAPAPRRRLGPLSGVARRGKLTWFLSHLPQDARILDVGCADGWFGAAARARGFTDVVGCDLEGPADIVGDIRSWPALGLEPHSFDAIVAFEVIEHGDFAPTFWQLLKPGGLLCATTPIPHMDAFCEALERVRLLQERGSIHTHLTDLRELREFEPVRYEHKAFVSQWGLLRARPADEVPAEAPRVRASAVARWLVERRRARTAEVPAAIYDTDYFLSNACEGLAEYLSRDLSILRRREVDHLDPRPGDRVLDLGCGRGESAAELHRRGCTVVAIDYSWDAVVLTAKLLDGDGAVSHADGTALPFRTGSFDRVLLGDVIEHLPWHLAVTCLREVERVLAPQGRAVIHTSPNTWFIRLVKPAVVRVMRALGRAEVVARFGEYDRLRGPMHPNELSPRSLPRLLRTAGVEGRTWVDPDVLRSGASEWTAGLSRSRAFRLAGAVLGRRPLRWVFGNDLYAIVEPAGSGAPGRASRRPTSARIAAAARRITTGSKDAR